MWKYKVWVLFSDGTKRYWEYLSWTDSLLDGLSEEILQVPDHSNYNCTCWTYKYFDDKKISNDFVKYMWDEDMYNFSFSDSIEWRIVSDHGLELVECFTNYADGWFLALACKKCNIIKLPLDDFWDRVQRWITKDREKELEKLFENDINNYYKYTWEQ